MSCRAEDLIALLEEVAPPEWAEDWDNVGLQVGSAQGEVEVALVCLDFTRETLDEALERGAGLMITHHPPIFRPLRSLADTDPLARLLGDAFARGLCVYAAHTNLDVSPRGVSAALADRLGLVAHRPLAPAAEVGDYKLVTFLPPHEVAAVSEALFAAGAGVIGDYRGCSFRLEGTGTFVPGPDARPAYGEPGRPNKVEEIRLEVRVGRRELSAALEALLASHPYEEPAYDIYPLAGRVPGAGMGRMGELREAVRLAELAESCTRALGNPGVRLAGDPERQVSRVAVCGGSGGGLVSTAARAGAEVLVTGDVGYHAAREALALGIAVIDAGHYHTELPVVGHLASMLSRMAEERGLKATVVASDRNACPWSNGGLD
ncbi:MAG: Nif3-like dinuclear metal center hexameric protein [Actinobacteria bacterium]|nr:Nif3-like dinuclear metal center hexameric protein [Actinomycetota bacterium]